MQPKRVLIVDDDPDIREIAMLSFELAGGWETREAASGREGLAMACEDPPDAIVLDIMMPETDGPATLALLQSDARTRHVPVIFLTAKVALADSRRYLALGVSGFITKPFDALRLPAEISAIIAETTGLRSQLDRGRCSQHGGKGHQHPHGQGGNTPAACDGERR
jgi:CheY-like chemotaxis protein